MEPSADPSDHLIRVPPHPGPDGTPHVACVTVRTGGFGAQELEAAGAAHVADGLEEVLDADWAAFVARGG